jgi:hypothetical protein
MIDPQGLHVWGLISYTGFVFVLISNIVFSPPEDYRSNNSRDIASISRDWYLLHEIYLAICP